MSETPKELLPILAHGANLRPGQGDSANWHGDCPFCGKVDHFFADPHTGKYDCKVCGKAGNAITFLGEMAKKYSAAMTLSRRKALSEHRGLPPSVLKDAGIGWSEDQRCYMLPCRSRSGTVRDIRRYKLKEKKLKSTPGCEVQLWGIEALAEAKAGTVVWLCEGEWDGMAMRWLLREAGREGDVVVAVPGANTLKKEWYELFAGMRVRAMYDNDKAGDQGAAKVFETIKNFAAETKWVHWPSGSKEGWDTRDFVLDRLRDGGDAGEALEDLETLLRDEPRVKPEAKKDSVDAAWTPPEGMEPLREMNLEEVLQVFRDSIQMTREMEQMLKVMLAVALSNDVISDPIWLYLVGPPGAGKTLMLSAFQGSQRCVFRSTLTPASLVSGWKAENGQDPSLIPRLNNKTLIAKDFTEILDMNSIAQDEIFSTLRGAYDGHVQKSFGNGVQREYKNCHFSILAGVTHAIYGHQKAHLGERFLRYELRSLDHLRMDSVLEAAIDSIGAEHETELKLQHAVACFLQKKVEVLPPLSAEVRHKMKCLVKLAARLRAQVARDQRNPEVVSYRPHAELGTRLVKQLAKLARSIAFVEGREEAGDDEYEIALRVAFDTVGGYSFDIVHAMIDAGGHATRPEIADLINAKQSTLYRRFDDLAEIGVLIREQMREQPGSGRPAQMWKVNPEVAEMWAAAIDGANPWRDLDKPRPASSTRGKTSSGSSTRSSDSRSTRRSLAKADSSSGRRRALAAT